ncbi:MAG: PfkB family carbohydrate kinase [Bacillota bacterium]|nr:PfkB family carbohydrate kinase [Bacillota bacterium]
MFDVTAAGELLIDFTPAGLSVRSHPLYEQNPGGAPANVLACLSRLGHKTAFIGKVGNDLFGKSLVDVLSVAGIDCQALTMTDHCHTTLAFVHLNDQGDRSFSFYRNPGADLMLTPADIPSELIDQSRIFHFGSVSMTADPARSATLAAVRQARTAGCLISYDPNLRLMLWPTADEARATILAAMSSVDILKISEEELLFLTGEKDLASGAAWFFSRYGIALILITLGPRGAYAATRNAAAIHPAYAVHTIDTTGAGDAFTGAFLDRLLRDGGMLADLTEDDLKHYLAFANAAGSLATTKTGAIPAMPTLDEIEDCLKDRPQLRHSQ